jgi:hypothetical protein
MGDGSRDVSQGEQDVRQDASQGVSDVENAPDNAAKDAGDAVSLAGVITSIARTRLIDTYRSETPRTLARVSRTPTTKASSRGPTTEHVLDIHELAQLYYCTVSASPICRPHTVQHHTTELGRGIPPMGVIIKSNMKVRKGD